MPHIFMVVFIVCFRSDCNTGDVKNLRVIFVVFLWIPAVFSSHPCSYFVSRLLRLSHHAGICVHLNAVSLMCLHLFTNFTSVVKLSSLWTMIVHIPPSSAPFVLCAIKSQLICDNPNRVSSRVCVIFKEWFHQMYIFNLSYLKYLSSDPLQSIHARYHSAFNLSDLHAGRSSICLRGPSLLEHWHTHFWNGKHVEHALEHH